jgi:hypothetical protein
MCTSKSQYKQPPYDHPHTKEANIHPQFLKVTPQTWSSSGCTVDTTKSTHHGNIQTCTLIEKLRQTNNIQDINELQAINQNHQYPQNTHTYTQPLTHTWQTQPRKIFKKQTL